ncbi:transcriptional repressor LexA [Cyclobacterium sediminis]
MKLHKTQEKILSMLTSNLEGALTIRRLKEVLELSSTSLVHHHIAQLEKKGYLKRNPNNRADFQVLFNPEAPVTFINLYGLAKCGPNGILLSGDPIDRIPLPSSLIKFPIEDAFLVKAIGDSMEPEIKSNDLIIAKKQRVFNNGDIVICTYNEQTIIKKIRCLESERIMLESLNSEYDPIILNNEEDINVQGVFKGLIRN